MQALPGSHKGIKNIYENQGVCRYAITNIFLIHKRIYQYYLLQVLNMGNIYVGMSIALGLFLLFLILTIISNLFKSLKKQILPDHNSTLIIKTLSDHREGIKNDRKINIAWPVLLETENGTVRAETKDMNLSGAFIRCKNPLGLQEQFRLKIFVPEQDPIILNAEVVWSNGNIPEEEVVTRGMKIRFIKNLEKDRDILNSTLKIHIASINNTPLQQRKSDCIFL